LNMEERQLELLKCAFHGRLLKVQELLAAESGLVSLQARTPKGQTVLHIAALGGRFATVQWLLEFGGLDVAERDDYGMDVWELLARHLLRRVESDATALTALLRVMVFRSAPFPELIEMLSPENAQVIRDGERLRAGLPTYILQRLAILDAHCPLPVKELRALVGGYDALTTTNEIWATGLGELTRPQASPEVIVQRPQATLTILVLWAIFNVVMLPWNMLKMLGCQSRRQ
jgi:hypothetical protein